MDCKVHTYNTEQEVQDAIATINAALEIPKSLTSMTRTYTEPQQLEDGRWFIRADKNTEQILGAAQTIVLPDIKPQILNS